MRRVLLAFLLAAPPIISQADELGNQFFPRSELRVIRRQAAGLVVAEGARAPLEKPSWSLGVGAAIDHGPQGDRTWTTPFDLNLTSADQRTAFDLEGDGYTHDRTGGLSASGLADVTVAGSHVFGIDSGGKIRLGAALVVPTHGEVGSTAPAERVVGAFVQPFGAVAASLQGSVTHRGDVAAGSRFGKAALGQVAWSLSGAVQDVAAQLIRSWRAGGSGATEAAIAMDFRVTSSVNGSLNVARGLGSGARDTSAEFDLTFQF